jgi:serine/threonine-protein kinase SRPK3
VACLSPAALPTTRATDATDVEEGRAAYGPGGFHPVYVGDVFSEKYQVLSKIGYGVYSTVWLVKDLSKP